MRGYPRQNQQSPIANGDGGNQVIKDQFAKRLYAAVVAKGWTQSEMARRSGLSRDKISTYILGKALPTPPSLKAIAETLGMKEEELIPSLEEALKPSGAPINAFSFTEVAPGKVRLQINKVVKLSTAMKVGQIITEDDAETSD